MRIGDWKKIVVHTFLAAIFMTGLSLSAGDVFAEETGTFEGTLTDLYVPRKR